MSSEPIISPAGPPRTITLFTATCIVVANMVGLGIFTSLGFQVGDLPSGFVILCLWVTGGLCALCGALAYGELAAALPRSGGEYHFLSVIYHPAIGFLAGWVSITIGFAAPVAVAAIACANYFQSAFPAAQGPVLARLFAIGLVALVTGVHLMGTSKGSHFQNAATVLKVLLIAAMIAGGFTLGHPQPIAFLPRSGDGALIASIPFAVSLFWVMFSYSGWNASVYIIGEVREAKRNVPLSNLIGTIGVTILYVLLNSAMLRAAPLASLAGKLDVTTVAAASVFGEMAGRIVSGLICAGLVATVSSMVFIGPRVSMAMGQDWPLFRPLARVTGNGVPATAMLLQGAISAVLILTATYEQVTSYTTFALSLCSCFAVLGVFVLRVRQPNLPRPIRTWGYPITPAIFLIVNCWMLYCLLWKKSGESLASLITMALGLVCYWVNCRMKSTAAAGAKSDRSTE